MYIENAFEAEAAKRFQQGNPYTATFNGETIFYQWNFSSIDDLKATCRGAVMGLRKFRAKVSLEVRNNEDCIVWIQQ